MKKIKRIINLKKFKFPIITKPVNEGSSLGVEICKNTKELFNSINRLFKKYDELILEEFIGGQEIQAAVINGNALGAIELIPKRSFYDYKALNIQKKQKQNMLCPLNYQLKNILKF